MHLLRETHLLARDDPDNQERLHLHTELTRMYAAIIRFKAKTWTKQRAHYTETRLANQLQQVENTSWTDKECQRIAKRITKYRRKLLTCIRHPNVLPENNTAERGIWPVVTHRKITSGSRSDKGAQTYQVNKSVMKTSVWRVVTWWLNCARRCTRAPGRQKSPRRQSNNCFAG
ncbi:MAG: hypothetical protein COT71_00210 [Candidatus Andersenbacteria bacterium CG10_big_fil_rev_8_21_14_0_10_54_11]|uniref:Transposase IS66 central domain-containing protein n=1 Tax=Candidatus Andersenbacteria bacterium CG10_big_fil_rev_8_21_14_0_10_54_11 TaxID=1974485 RepID=A0A2M6X0M7_9BACT|nr:MAG: hypothetical protein COT71_00210 [Candidatus Andersenbacteria bacterium CG10_big_fil_rev_8_21_14_0_10_54_11]